MRTIERKPVLIKNAIPNQTKTANSLTVYEWNTFINQLRTQTNLNTEYLEKLYYVLFGPLDSNKPPLVEVTDLPTLTADINALAQTIAEINRIVEEIQAYFEEFPKGYREIEISITEPEDKTKDKLWLKIL
jgi:DNA integrity scanning protein DisA with diadenylate cyclase activity